MAHLEMKIEYRPGETIFGNIWKSDNREIKGNVVLVHGMAEHSLRYAPFAEFLNKNGFDVYACDHIGHGKAVSQDPKVLYKYGNWPQNGFDQSIERVDAVVEYVHKVSDKPVVVFGHSLGSFLTTGYYERHYDNAAAFIICGSAYNNATYKMSTFLTGVMNVFKSKKAKNRESKLLTSAMTKTMNKKQVPFKDNYKTVNAWLSYNEDNVKTYDNDPESGFPCTFNFYYSMFHGQQAIWKKKAINAVRDPRPVLLIVGQDDPVGNYGKDVKNLYKFIKKHQDNVDIRLFEHMKHEVLNEDKKQEVYDYILSFINKSI